MGNAAFNQEGKFHLHVAPIWRQGTTVQVDGLDVNGKPAQYGGQAVEGVDEEGDEFVLVVIPGISLPQLKTFDPSQLR